MKTILIKNQVISIIRKLPIRTYRHKPTNTIKIVHYLEIKCIDCGDPKKVSIDNLFKAKGFRCRICTNKKSSIERRATTNEQAIEIILNRFVLTLTKNCTLTREEIKKLIFSNCYYCGVAPLRKDKVYNIYINGIDRVDNAIGYVNNNCVSCCRICNYAKGTMSLEAFYSWVYRIAKFNGYTKS